MRWLGVSENGLTQPTPILDVGLSRNGAFAVTSDPRCVFRVFDLESERCIADAKVPARWKANFDRLRDVSVSDDGRRVVGQLEGCVVSGDVTAWDPVVESSTTFFGRARALPDGRRWAHLFGELQVHDGETAHAYSDPRGRGVDLDVSASGRLVAAFHDEDGPGMLRIFSPTLELQASIEVKEVLHAGRVAFVDDDHVVAQSHDGRVHFWDVAKGSLQSSETLVDRWQTRLLAPLRVVCTSDGSKAVYRSAIDLVTGESIVTTPTASWAVSGDGRVLVAARGASLVRCDPRTFEELEPPPLLRTSIRGLAFEPSGDRLWSADDEHAHRWSLHDGRVDETIALPPAEEGTYVVGNASALVVRETYKSAVRLALPSGERAGASKGSWRDLPVSFDGSLVARSTGASIQLQTWDEKITAEWPVSAKVSAAAFSSDGERFVTCYRGGHVEVRRVATGAILSTLESGSPRTFSIAVSPDARWLAVCSDSPSVYVVDIERGATAFVLRLSRRTVGPVALSGDGRWVAASDQRSTVVWSLATGDRAQVVQAGAHSLAFSPDSRRLAIGGDGRLGIVTL